MSRRALSARFGSAVADPVPETLPDPVVDVRDVAVTLGATRVVDGVDLAVSPGEFVGLVGPNGAGKTTLLRTVGATLSPDRGTVRVAGEDVHDLGSKAASRLVATVPQDTSFSFDFSVRDAVEMGRTPHVARFGRVDEADRDAVERAMARAEVAEFADRSVTAISGGERSRVLLARALAQQTPVMLLDEPTASLDVNHQIRTLDLVADLVADERTAVAAIHDLDLAARYCDRLVVVADGGVLDAGPPEAVLTRDTLRAAFDADAVVTDDPVTERPHVTALSEAADGDDEAADANAAPDAATNEDPATDAATDDDPSLPDRVHVVAGGGEAGPLLTRLDRLDLAVSVGPVPAGDTDREVAAALEMDVLAVDPLAGVDEGVRDRLVERLAVADAVVVADVDLTAGLAPVLAAVADSGTPTVVVEGRDLARRGADEAATAAFRSLRDSGRVAAVDAVGEALRAVDAASTDSHDRDGDGDAADADAPGADADAADH